MNDVTIHDEKLLSELGKSERPVMFRGPDGKMFGYFTPLNLANLQPQISDEEIQRRIAVGGGRKLSDILADLEKQA